MSMQLEPGFTLGDTDNTKEADNEEYKTNNTTNEQAINNLDNLNEAEGQEGSTTYENKEQANEPNLNNNNINQLAQPAQINTTQVSQVNNDKHNQEIKAPTKQKQNNSYNIYTVISTTIIVIVAIAIACSQFIFAAPHNITNGDKLTCPNIDNPLEIKLTDKKKKVFAYNKFREHSTNTYTNYEWIIKNNDNKCDYISYGERTDTLTLIDFKDCKPFDFHIQLAMNSVEKRFLHEVPHSKMCDIHLKFVYPPEEIIPNSNIFHCPNDAENMDEIQLTSKNTIIDATYSTHPSNTKYKWIIQHENENENPCKCGITGYETGQLKISQFSQCSPFEMHVKLFMNAMVNGYQNHSKQCNMNLKYVYPPVEMVENSDVFHCPCTDEEILLTSSTKMMTAKNSTYPSNTIYQWNFAENVSGCNYNFLGENTNEISISKFNECEPFHMLITLKFNAIIKGYIQHTKSCNINLNFVYPPAQLINDSDIFSCPDIELPLYLSLSTLNETISAKLSSHPPNTIYKWTIKHNGPACTYRIVGQNTDSFSILGVGVFPLCEPFKMNVTLVMNATTNPYTTQIKTCEMNLIFHDNPVFGIDLGTTYSCISYQDNTQNAYYRRHTHMVVADKKLNEYCVRSAVYFTYDKQGNKQTVIGPDAMNKLKDDPKNVFYDIKRIVGRSPNDKKFESFKKSHDFKILDDNKKVNIPNWNETLFFEQILSILLTHLVEFASKDFYDKKQGYNPFKYIQDVVVSAPALFHNGQRKGIRSACHLSGLNPVKLLIEPSAASIAHSYYLKVPDKRTNRFLAFDFGGGTLDCSVMRCAGVECTVLSVHGDSSLGGIDFDHVIYNIIIEKFKEQHGWSDISNALRSKIRQMSEQIKIELTKSTDYKLSLRDDKGSMKNIIITKDEFEQHPKTQALIEGAINVAKHAIDLAEKNSVEMILLIGGTSKIPIIQQSLEHEFGNNKSGNILVLSDDIDVQLMVGTGCGIIGGAIAYQSYSDILDVVLTDLLPLSIGYQECVPIDKGNIDCKRMRKIILKNTAYPTRETIQICQKRADGNKLKLKLYEGDDIHVYNNYFLGEIVIDNIQPRDVNVCDNVLLSFIVDENGIVHCEAETNPKYGNVKKYHIKIASENSKHGTIEKENVIKLSQNMKSWYNPRAFNLMRKLFDTDPELNSLQLFDDE